MSTPNPTQMTTREKVRDALWRYAPDRTERLATAAMIAAAGVFALSNWLRKGRYQ